MPHCLPHPKPTNQCQPQSNQSTYFLLQLLCKRLDLRYYEVGKNFFSGEEVLAKPLADYLPPRVTEFISFEATTASLHVCITPLECLVLSPAVNIKGSTAHPAAFDPQFFQFILNHSLCHVRLPPATHQTTCITPSQWQQDAHTCRSAVFITHHTPKVQPIHDVLALLRPA